MSLQFLNAHSSAEPHADAVWGAHWTPDDRVVSISADGRIKLYDASSGQIVREQPPHTLGIVSLSVPPSGGRALYNTIEGLTTLWDLNDGSTVGKHESYARTGSSISEPAWSVSLHPSGTSYASTGASGNVTIHSAEPSTFGDALQKLESGRTKFGMYTAHSPDGTRVALSTETGQIYVFDLGTGTLTTTYTSHAMAVRSLAWSADSQLLLSASDDRRLVLHDVRAGAAGGRPGSGAVAALSGHAAWVLSTAISPDGRLALSGSADKTIKVWDIAARAAVSTIQDTGEVWAVSWRPHVPGPGSAGAFVTGTEDGTVKWWRSAGTS